MDRQFARDLESLKVQLLRMGGAVEQAVLKAVEALETQDARLAEEVFEDDRAIDELELVIEDHCFHLLALQQPLASDLRFLMAALKISNDLERVGDHAVNIAGSAVRLAGRAGIEPLGDVGRMARLAYGMLHQSLEAFVQGDAASARQVCARDDEVDALNRRLFRELIAFITRDPSLTTPAMELVLVARNLERIADLATNVGEEVVFVAQARVIKHHHEETASGPSPAS